MTDADQIRSWPARVTGELISEPFDAGRITGLRHDVSRCAATAGLDGELLDDFVLAVNELVTNAVRHGGGRGSLRLWLAGGRLVCEVTDAGAGIPAGTAYGRDRPSLNVAGGWGMWLARELSDSMKVSTGPHGTTVQISAATPQARLGSPGSPS